MMNNEYEIEVSSPLLRTGLTIKTKVSKKYVSKAVKEIVELVREINKHDDE